jgi:uncharacterized surface protein with fasciclin (FAS1) repeats
MRNLSLGLSSLLVLSLSACGSTDDDVTDTGSEGSSMHDDMNDHDDDSAAPEQSSIVDVAVAAGGFDTLLAAVDAAGLTDTLDSDGPFTVFAPTDDAFAALPAGTVDALLADVPALTDILLYHVVAGELDAAAVVGSSLIETLQGSDLKVTSDGGVYVNDAMVTVTDIVADNGIIHVIDTVVVPPGDIVSIAASDSQFSTLVTAVSEAGLVDALSGEGPFTVFAPTNAAFDALPAGTVEALLEDIPALTDVLLFHVVDGKVPAEDVVASDALLTLQGSEADIYVDENGVSIAGAMIEITDIPASNGVIHVIGSVMLPE